MTWKHQTKTTALPKSPEICFEMFTLQVIQLINFLTKYCKPGISKIRILYNYLENTKGLQSDFFRVTTWFSIWTSAPCFCCTTISWAASPQHLVNSYTQFKHENLCSPRRCKTSYYVITPHETWQWEENMILLLIVEIKCLCQSNSFVLTCHSLFKVNPSRMSQYTLWRKGTLISNTLKMTAS